MLFRSVSRWSKIGRAHHLRQLACKHRCDRIPKVGKLPAPSRHRSAILSQTARDSRHSPIAVSRWSKICPIVCPRPLVCKHRCDRIPKVGKLPAPSRHHSLTISQTVRDSRHSPVSVSRWSKICPTARPRPLVCKHRCDPIPEIGQTARAIAPSLSHILADGARQPAQSHRCISMVQIRRARHLRQTCLHAITGVTGYRSANCPRRSAIALSWTTLVPRSGSAYPGLTLPPDVCRRRTCTMPHKAVEQPKVSKLPARHQTIPLRNSRRLWAAAGTLPPPFLHGPKSIASIPRHFRNS